MRGDPHNNGRQSPAEEERIPSAVPRRGAPHASASRQGGVGAGPAASEMGERERERVRRCRWTPIGTYRRLFLFVSHWTWAEERSGSAIAFGSPQSACPVEENGYRVIASILSSRDSASIPVSARKVPSPRKVSFSHPRPVIKVYISFLNLDFCAKGKCFLGRISLGLFGQIRSIFIVDCLTSRFFLSDHCFPCES